MSLAIPTVFLFRVAAPSVTSPSPPRSALLPCVVLCAATVAAYANTFAVPFVFDDIAAVTQNPSLAGFLSAFVPPPGLSTTGRPLANFSLALNHALSGEAPWSYHALNLALHLANALLLFALLRHTLVSLNAPSPIRHGETTAFAATLLWSLHPLHPAAVTYVMQRTELLASLALLLTLFAFVRAAASPSAHTVNRWLAVSVVAALAGMASKEIAVITPLLVLLYDRTFVSPSFAIALRTRPRAYAALAATWLLLAALVLGTDNRGASAGLAAHLSFVDYALTQLWAVAHYLRLAVWPSPLVFDYGTALVTAPTALVIPALLLLALVVITIVGLRRRSAAGFCGAAFFLLLAPTSLVPIATQTIAEHRVYLALALPLTLLAAALAQACQRRLLWVCVPLALALGVATFARNVDYRSATALWSDTTLQRPANARAHYNLAVTLLAGSTTRDPVRAERELTETLRLDADHPLAAAKLGATRLELGRFADAIAPLQTALSREPDSFPLRSQLAAALVATGQIAVALPHLTRAVQLAPAHAAAHYNLGHALTQLGRYPEGLAQFEEAARLDPTDASARNNATRLRAYLAQPPTL